MYQGLILGTAEMQKKKVIFFDVDTQFDFLSPRGKLYIPDADKIIDNISSTRRFALENGYSIVASMDWHSFDNEEISLEPDYKTTFPSHCMASDPGAERTGYLGEIPLEYVETEQMQPAELQKLVEKEQFHLVIRTHSVNVFENPGMVKLLGLIEPQTVVVFGVALDVCVRHVVSGLLNWGRADIILLEDVVKGLGIKKDEDVLREFVQSGVRIKQLSELKEEL